MIPPASPFHPDNAADYQAWRKAKLAGYPGSVGELVVEVTNPKALTPIEHEALLARCRKANMAIYATQWGNVPDKGILLEMGRQFGLNRLDANYLSDEDAISTLTVAEKGHIKGEFIPYTNRPIRWHTDGYYNIPDRRIRGMTLHCVQPALSGGENALLDHEIAYLLLRDENPEYIRALMGEDVMTIPPREDESGVARAAETGSVFDALEGGQLYMRYTARTKSIVWKQDDATQTALAALEMILAAHSPYMFKSRLDAGMGLLCNNVLHDRTGYVDNPDAPRTLYRGRYIDRISGT
ncbi:MAG TPA: TauD/TfdA family dioxygenase [Thiobacillaceae bacterium]|nr:TauD/TfdA family dioxygenase [Thiobacillaceae bacterium]